MYNFVLNFNLERDIMEKICVKIGGRK